MAITEEQYRQAYQDYRDAGEFEKADKVAQQFRQMQEQQSVAETPVDYQLSESAKNFLPSLGRAASDFVAPLLSPIDTAKNIGALAKSGAYNLAQEVQDIVNPDGERLPNQEMGEAVAGMLADRYGSLDALKTTAMEDPAGLLLDASSVLTGGGSLLAKAPGVVGKAGQQVSNIGQTIDPLTGLLKAPAAAIEGITKQPVSGMLYQSAMKPSTTLSPEKRKELLKAGLELGATPQDKSVSKIQGQRAQLLDDIYDLESQAKATDVVDPQGLFKYVDDVKAEHAPPIIDTVADLKAIDDVVDTMQEAIFMNGGNSLTAKDLARIKRDIYKKVDFNKSSKRGAYDLPTDKTRKAIARAAKEAIEELVPEVKQKNQLYGVMTELQEKLQIPAANRIGNRDLVGLGLPVTASTGQVLGGNAGGLLAAGVGILDRPVIKSKAAIGINRLGKAVRSPSAPFLATSTAQMGRLTQAEEERKKRDIK